VSGPGLQRTQDEEVDGALDEGEGGVGGEAAYGVGVLFGAVNIVLQRRGR